MKCFLLLLATVAQCPLTDALFIAPLPTTTSLAVQRINGAASSSRLFMSSRPSFVNTTTSDMTSLYPPPSDSSSSAQIFSQVVSNDATATETAPLGALHIVESAASTTTTEAAKEATTTTTPNDDDSMESRQRDSIKFSQILALNSGVVNGIFLSGILGRIQAVTPVTDSWTKGAIAMTTTGGAGHRALFLAAVLLSFSMGSMLTGLLNPKPELWNLQQRTKPLLLACSLMATAAALVATTAGSAVVPVVAFFLVCMASGVQNSFSSTLTQNWCRTTHMTGTTTDLFTIVGQNLAGNASSRFKIPIYGGLISMFTLGGLLAGAWGVKSPNRAAVCLGASSMLYLVMAIPSLGTKLVQGLSRGKA